MKKQLKLWEDLGNQWGLLRNWLRTFPLPPTRILLILILVPLPLLVVHGVLKKYFQELKRKRSQKVRRKRRLTRLQRAVLLKTLRDRRRKYRHEKGRLSELEDEE
jgi:hypothetical protein